MEEIIELITSNVNLAHLVSGLINKVSEEKENNKNVENTLKAFYENISALQKENMELKQALEDKNNAPVEAVVVDEEKKKEEK